MSTNQTARDALRSMIETFIRGDDRSLNFVDRIEGLLRQSFRNDPIYEELVDDLARYSPGGGKSLVDEDGLARQLKYVLDLFFRER